MKKKRLLYAFLTAICVFGLCTLGISAEDARTVTATTNASVAQDSYNYCYVYLDDLTDLSALTVSVHYDAEKISVQSVYNSVSCLVHDYSNKSGCLQFSYVFDGEGSASKTRLFYFFYKVNATAEPGDTYFDIVVSDAFGKELDEININGSRCSLTVTEKPVTKTCTVSASSYTLSTAVKEEFSLTYRLSTYQIASGSFTVQYDSELFEVVEVTKGAFLDNKVADVNTRLDGSVAVSFVGTAYNTKYDLVTVKFRTIKNVSESSGISLSVAELYDLELNPITCKGYTSTVNVLHDETYVDDCPAMLLASSYNRIDGKVTLKIMLEENSHLGAGDFVLNFDSEILTYESSEKGFTPTFFNINEKNASKGILKFSILSISDITDAQTVLTVTFAVKDGIEDRTADFTISGSGLTDSLTKSIMLNFIDTSAKINEKVVFGMSLLLDGKIGVKVSANSDDVLGLTLSNVIGTDNYVDFGENNYALFYLDPKDVSNARLSFTVRYQNVSKTETESFTVCVSDYIDALKMSQDEDVVKLATAFENYFNATADYFYKATEFDTIADLTEAELDDLASKITHTKNGEIAGLEFSSTSLILEEDTVIRHYFKITDNTIKTEADLTDRYTVSGGAELKFSTKKHEPGVRYAYTEIVDVSSNELSTAKSVKVTDRLGDSVTIDFSALAYVDLCLNSDDERLCNLVKALYRYSVESDAYMKQ